MRSLPDRLRLPLACIATASLSVSLVGVHLTPPPSSPLPLAAAELFGISLPLTVAWFAFSGLCMLANGSAGLAGLIASGSRFAGQAALFAGIPVWVYWYLHLVFRVV